MNCLPCVQEVQFGQLLPSDNNISINGVNYPITWTIDNLVNNIPNFYFALGVMGLNTLHTTIAIGSGMDMTISVMRGIVPIIVINEFIRGRPDDRR